MSNEPEFWNAELLSLSLCLVRFFPPKNGIAIHAEPTKIPPLLVRSSCVGSNPKLSQTTLQLHAVANVMCYRTHEELGTVYSTGCLACLVASRVDST